jgi:hypothetical protein
MRLFLVGKSKMTGDTMQPFVITKLLGGLGNQLFQYAIGRRIAELNAMDLKLDISPFQEYPLRKYCLGNFRIRENFSTTEDIEHIIMNRNLNKFYLTFPVLKPKERILLVREKRREYEYNKRYLSIRNNIYLSGYWQSEKYFKEIASIIRKEFQLKDRPSEPSRRMAEVIAGCEAVNLHIRRGDYASNPQTNQYHGLCTLDYYYAAINRLTSQLKTPHFFIFSDDIPWVRENLKLPYPTVYVSHNGEERDYEDLWLMSLCKYHIIANSSFSWWGAWLAEYEGKIVIAPQKWLNNSEINTLDLVPESWVKI